MASATVGFLSPVPISGSSCLVHRKATCPAVVQGDATGTLARNSGFTAPFSLRQTQRRPSFAVRPLPIRCSEESDPGESSEKEKERKFVHKFDPNSETVSQDCSTRLYCVFFCGVNYVVL